MLKYVDYDIVFQEVPGHVTLAVNLSLCPNRCPGCHSPQLQQDRGIELTAERLDALLERYGAQITCLCMMGGDNDPAAVARLLAHVRRRCDGKVSTAWYSGRERLPEGLDLAPFDYIKLGPWIASSGDLRSPSGNQRFYRVDAQGALHDRTCLFRR